MENPTQKAFSRWKIMLAAGIGLSISFWMFYSSFTDTQFTEATGVGTHRWVDGNHNGKIDYSLPEDFIKDENGGYTIQTISSSLKNINWSQQTVFWLLGAVLFTAGRDFFYMLRIRLLTKDRLSWKASFYVIMLWEFASALSPGVVGGAAVAMFILNREGVPFGKATAIVIITAFMDNLFYVVMIPLVFLFVHHTDVLSSNQSESIFLFWWFWVGFSIILFICLLLYLTLFWFPKMATNFLLFIFKIPFLKRWKFIAKEWGKDIEKASHEFKKESIAFWIKVFLSTFGSWISRYLVINAILNAFLDLGFIDNIRIVGKQLILWLFMLVSPTPGGSGVAEYAFGELLSDFGTSAFLLATLALIWRLISYFPYLIIGSALLPSWAKRSN